MNQDQRKFLIARVEKTFTNQSNEIKKEEITKPSLNNYLVASFLDGTVQFADIEKLKSKMKETVLRFGHSDKLIKESDSFYRTSSNKKAENTVEVEAKDLFIIPDAYKKARAEYDMAMDKRRVKLEELEAKRDTILLKIQIGSNAVLDKLITQVDNLADLDIMNSQFLLS